MRIIEQKHTVLESPWFGFVRIADDVFLVRLNLCRTTPLDACRKCRAATSHQTRGLVSFRNDLIGIHSQRFFVGGIFTILSNVVVPFPQLPVNSRIRP